MRGVNHIAWRLAFLAGVISALVTERFVLGRHIDRLCLDLSDGVVDCGGGERKRSLEL